jgi:hypothetical protein
MDKVNQAGKKLKNIQKESGLNARRSHENFPQPERIVNSFNILHPYRTTFVTTPNAVALLSLKITEFPTPCSVNPPLLNISTDSDHYGDNPGTIVRLYNTTQNIEPPNPDFLLVDGGIQVPLDGCYSVMWTSGAYGVGYYSDKTVTVEIRRNEYGVRTIGQGTTGYIQLLGPAIYFYTPASPVYAVVDCLAGDIIKVIMTQGDIAEKYPWYNGGLNGFFVSNPPYSAYVNVTLVALAEGGFDVMTVG